MKGPFRNAITVIAAVSLVALAGCDRENGNGKDAEVEQDALLNISLVNPVHTRIAGAAPATDTEITQFSVFVTNDTGAIAWKEHITANELVDFPVTTHAKKVYVIANSPDLTAGFTSLEELEAATNSIAYQYTTRWATGFTTVDLEFDANNVATIEIPLRFTTARIAVRVDNQLEGYTGTVGDGTLRLTELFLLNVRQYSMLFGAEGTSLIPPSIPEDNYIYSNGVNINQRQLYLYTPEDGSFNHAPFMSNPYTYSVSPQTTDYHFYVYEAPIGTKPEDFPMIVTLRGTNVDGKTTYFPVHFASYETFKSGEITTDGIRRGHSYNLTITITGNAKDPLGIDDPTKPMLSAKVNATLEIEEWEAVSIVKEF